MHQQAIGVMYHYVRPAEPATPAGIRPMALADFREQLDWLEENHRVLAPREFLNALRYGWGRDDLPPALLSFDDGTRDHLEVAAPELESRGLRGVFFCLAGASRDRAMPLTHAIHWALGDEDRLWHALLDTCGELALGDPAEAARIYHYEPERRARIKHAINFALAEPAAHAVVAACMRSAGVRERDLAAEWFLDDEGVIALHERGHAVGVHGVSHRGLSVLGPRQAAEEAREGMNWIGRLTGRRPAWYACPFGGSGTDDATRADLARRLDRLGFAATVGTTKRGIDPRPASTFELPRFDCIDLPPRAQLPRRRAA